MFMVANFQFLRELHHTLSKLPMPASPIGAHLLAARQGGAGDWAKAQSRIARRILSRPRLWREPKVRGRDGALPDKDSVQGEKYPYARPKVSAQTSESKNEVRRFLDFVFSPEGQTIVERVGFVPEK